MPHNASFLSSVVFATVATSLHRLATSTRNEAHIPLNLISQANCPLNRTVRVCGCVGGWHPRLRPRTQADAEPLNALRNGLFKVRRLHAPLQLLLLF